MVIKTGGNILAMGKSIYIKTCEIMQYWQYYDCAEISVVEQRIKGLANVKTYCCIVHDKDILPNGKVKPPHFHAVITFSNAKTIDCVATALKVEPQFVSRIHTSTKSAQLYLVHKNDSSKYQYSSTEVHANFDYCNFADDCKPKEKKENTANLIENGTIKEYNLFKYISIDEFARNKKYYQNCFEYRQNKLKGLNRNMECIFITGGSGTGKTTYAKMIASQKGYATYISSGGKNPLDNYKGEECIILDDTRSSTWSLTDFLKLTDNHTDSLVGCRYYNKSIAECKLLIVTSVKSIKEFYENATREDNEPLVQLLRRFPVLFEMFPETINVCAYNPEINLHAKMYTVKNPVAIMFNPKVGRQFAKDLINLMGLEVVDQRQLTIHSGDDDIF